MNKNSKQPNPKFQSALPEHSPMACVVKAPAFYVGQLVKTSLPREFVKYRKGMEVGVTYEVLACQTRGYPYGCVTDLVVAPFGSPTILVVPCVSGVVRA